MSKSLAEDGAKHEAACKRFVSEMGVGNGEACVLAWFDGSVRKIIVWPSPIRSQKRHEWPDTFEGYPVVVEKMPVARALTDAERTARKFA